MSVQKIVDLIEQFRVENNIFYDELSEEVDREIDKAKAKLLQDIKNFIINKSNVDGSN